MYENGAALFFTRLDEIVLIKTKSADSGYQSSGFSATDGPYQVQREYLQPYLGQ
jgi:hypothetical protein